MTAYTQGRQRFDELDALRGIAALWVVVFHLTFAFSHFWLRDQPELRDATTALAVDIQGPMANDLFFIISGYVICMTLDRSRTVAAFVVSRFTRLFPAYWMAVAISTAVSLVWPSTRWPVTPGQGLLNLTMLQDFLGVRKVDPSYWSLSVELGFYALMTLVLLTRQRHRIELIGFVWMAIGFIATVLLPDRGILLPWRILLLFALNYASLFYAGILFYKMRTDRFTLWRAAGVALCLVSRLASSDPSKLIETLIFAIFALSVAGRLPILRAPWLLFLGAISYSLYLVHQPIGYRLLLGLHALGAGPWSSLLITIGLEILLATVLTFAVERPGTQLLRRLYAAHRARSAATA